MSTIGDQTGIDELLNILWCLGSFGLADRVVMQAEEEQRQAQMEAGG